MILIAEDHADTRQLMLMILHRARHQAMAVEDGRAALAMACAARPELIILDYMMPNLDGLSTLRMLKSDPLTASIPVIIYTAAVTSEIRKAASELGAQAVLRKGDAWDRILAEIERYHPPGIA